jgi:transposase
MQLQVKTILNAIQHCEGFVYSDVQMRRDRHGRPTGVAVTIQARQGSRGQCSHCLRPAPGYDHLPERRFLFVPLWGLAVWFVYRSRRVQCDEHGVVVEHLPWAQGKRPVTTAMRLFLARWARRLSWRETARIFGTSWECVYRSVQWVVHWGLKHRELEGVEAIGVDEIHWGKGKGAHSFLTVIYQIDSHCRRLLWVGPKRTKAALRQGLDALGQKVVAGLRFVCSDMHKPYLAVIAELVGHALHILDRFHITLHLNQAVDEVRRGECARLRAASSAEDKPLKKMRWKLLRKGSDVRGKARGRLKALAASKHATGRAWILKEMFQHFWSYKSPTWAAGFLRCWTERALRSRLQPMGKVARMLRSHEDLIMNWFRAKGDISSGPVEGLNNKIRVVTRRSYGFRTYKAMEIALYHNLGKLPEPCAFTHKFC